MRRWLWICLALVIVVGAYWLWPLVSAGQLASAAQRGDTQGVIDRVDLPALRRSLSRQIALAYLKVTGRTQKLSGLSLTVAGAAATSVADPYIDELLTPANITALLGTGKIASVTVGGKAVAIDRAMPDFGRVFNSGIGSLIMGSYFDGPVSFVIPARLGSGQDQDYAIHLHLGGLTWRLSGLDLPPALVEDMARSIVTGEKPAAP